MNSQQIHVLYVYQGTNKKHIDARVKNGRKPYCLPQKKFVNVFYAINIQYLTPSLISNFICVEKMPFVNSTFLSVLFTMF